MTETELKTCLQTEATQTQTSWDYNLKLYALEGIIRRIAQHPRKNEVVIRGSLITRVWVKPDFRPVDDIDFLFDFPIDSARGVGFVRDSLAYDLGDFIKYDYENIEVVPTWIETPLPGERVFVPAKALGQDFLLQIDLASTTRLCLLLFGINILRLFLHGNPK